MVEPDDVSMSVITALNILGRAVSRDRQVAYAWRTVDDELRRLHRIERAAQEVSDQRGGALALYDLRRALDGA